MLADDDILNRELDKLIAEKVMISWKFTDDIQVICEHSLEDMAGTVWFVRPNGTIGVTGADYIVDFRPTVDPASCALVLDEIERRGWNWTWGFNSKESIYEFRIWGFSVGEDRNRYRAVCEAALQAAREE